MRKSILFLSFILLTTLAFSQSVSSDLSWINNSLEYEIWLEGPEVSNLFAGEIEPSKYVVEVKIDPKKMEYVDKITYSQWDHLLKDENSSFGANLLLYAHYERDATALVNTSYDEWILIHKNSDIEYWLEMLGNKLNK